MRKFLIVFLSALLVVGFSASVFAEVTIGGDARVRGIWQNNYNPDSNNPKYAGNFNSDVDNDSRYYDSRVRLKFTAKVNGVEVRSRVVLIDGKWGKNYEYENGNPKDLNGDGVVDEKDMVEQYNRTVTTDYAYLHVPVGSVTIDAGRYPLSWGNKFYVWDVKKDLIKVSSKVGYAEVGGYINKNIELLQGDNRGDTDSYALMAVGRFSGLEAGLLGIYEYDDTLDDYGIVIDPFLKGMAGGIGVAAELAIKSGDLLEDSQGNSRHGSFVQISKAIGALTVGGVAAYAANGYVADKHFTPTVFIGKDQPTAIMNFGAVDDETTLGVVGFVNYKVLDKLTVGGAGAYVSLGGQKYDDSGDDASAAELDARLKYKLAKNTTYSVDFGYLIPSDLSANDDAAIALAHKIQIKF